MTSAVQSVHFVVIGRPMPAIQAIEDVTGDSSAYSILVPMTILCSEVSGPVEKEGYRATRQGPDRLIAISPTKRSDPGPQQPVNETARELLNQSRDHNIPIVLLSDCRSCASAMFYLRGRRLASKPLTRTRQNLLSRFLRDTVPWGF